MLNVAKIKMLITALMLVLPGLSSGSTRRPCQGLNTLVEAASVLEIRHSAILDAASLTQPTVLSAENWIERNLPHLGPASTVYLIRILKTGKIDKLGEANRRIRAAHETPFSPFFVMNVLSLYSLSHEPS